MTRLSPQQSRLQDDLRGLIAGEVRCDVVTQQLYANDASPFEIRPQGVVCPRTTADVVCCVKYAKENGISLHARGAGTGRTGGALGKGLILDFSRFMRRVIHSEEKFIRVQPGLTLSRLNHHLKRLHLRRLGPDSGFRPATTVGSILGGDGAGSRWLQYGSPRDHLHSLEVILATGEVLELRCSGTETFFSQGEERPHVSDRLNVLGEEVRTILSPAQKEIERLQRKDRPDRAGFRLEGVLLPENNGQVDLARLLTGSEGTLGIITEATFKTVSLPAVENSLLILFDSLEKAVRSIPKILQVTPGFCELMDRRRVNMVREWDKRAQPLLPQESEAVVLVEVTGEAGHGIRGQLLNLVEILQLKERACFGTHLAEHEDDRRLFRHLFEKGELALARMPRSVRSVSLFDGICVPVEHLPQFLLNVQNIYKRNEVSASFFGHVGQGQIQIQTIFPVTRKKVGDLLRRLAEEVFYEVVQQGGSISCAGALGLMGTPFLRMQHETLYPLFRQIKELFDPQHILNPGKVVADPVESMPDWSKILRREFVRNGE